MGRGYRGSGGCDLAVVAAQRHDRFGVLDVEDEFTVRSAPRSPSGLRTARFFLPTVERRRRHEGADEAAKCREHLDDLSLCRERCCPAAADAPVKRQSR